MASLKDMASRVASRVASENPLDGLRKAKVVAILNDLLAPHIKGLFRDNHWRPIQDIRKAFEAEGIPLEGTKSQYEKENGVDVRKVWTFEVPFVNQNERKDVCYVHVTAAGAGSVDDPLAVYDVTAYAV